MILQINRTLAPIVEDLRRIQNLTREQAYLKQDKKLLDHTYEIVSAALKQAEEAVSRRNRKNQQEALETARNAYKPVAFERSEVAQRLLEIDQQLELIGEPEVLYQDLLKLKETYIREEKHPFSEQLFEFSKQLSELNAELKEIQEAGRAVQQGIVMISRLIHESKDFGDFGNSIYHGYGQRLSYFLTLVPPVHRQMQEILKEWHDLDYPFPVGDIGRFTHFYQRISVIVQKERKFITGLNYVHGFCAYHQQLLRKLESRLKFSYDFLKGRIQGVEQMRERKLAQVR